MSKSETLIYAWQRKYEWKSRAIAYDSSLVEETRVTDLIERRKSMERKMRIAGKLEAKALLALDQLDIKRVSARAIVEMLTLANTLENEAADIQQSSAEDKVTEIIITRAERV